MHFVKEQIVFLIHNKLNNLMFIHVYTQNIHVLYDTYKYFNLFFWGLAKLSFLNKIIWLVVQS